jgi:hypothetical protein
LTVDLERSYVADKSICKTAEASVVSQKFVEKLQTMAAAEGRTQIPLNPPFSKGEVSLQDANPSLEKHVLSAVEGRGRGDFWAE